MVEGVTAHKNMTETRDLLSRAYFPGPKSENEAWAREEFAAILDDWFHWRREGFPGDPEIVFWDEQLRREFLGERANLAQHLNELIHALRAEVPSYSPRYIGHMMSEISLPALFGHFATLLHNPNNVSGEASKVGTAIEREAIKMLAEMIGYDPYEAQGHFTSGGTVANFEGVWRARYRLDHWLSLALYLAESGAERFKLPDAAHIGWRRFETLCHRHSVTDAALRSCSAVAGNAAHVLQRISRAIGHDYLGPVVLVPGNKHYSWRKAANVFGLGEESFWSVDLDANGRLDLSALSRRIDEATHSRRPVLMVVSVAGTTETGEIDPIDRVADFLDDLEKRRGWRIWHHVDAAYGGFLCSLLGGTNETVLRPQSRHALAAIGRTDSVTIDPHKLGYVPYACGAFLARDKSSYAVSSFDAPYLDRGLPGTDKWSSTLEGSRPASGAAATWLTGKTIGFGHARFGALLASTISAARALMRGVSKEVPIARFLEPAETNIVCFSLAESGEKLSISNARTMAAFDAILASSQFWVSKTVLGGDYRAQIGAHVCKYGGVDDTNKLVLIRCVFMNPYWAGVRVTRALVPQFASLVSEAIKAHDVTVA